MPTGGKRCRVHEEGASNLLAAVGTMDVPEDVKARADAGQFL